jgi:hypothetical protein
MSTFLNISEGYMIRQMFATIFRPAIKEVECGETVEQEIARYRASLEQKRLEAIEKMGEKWILHPSHHVKKKEIPENSLGFKTA